MMDPTKYAEQFISEQRLHPMTLFYRAIVSMPGLGIALYFAFSNSDSMDMTMILIMLAMGLLIFPAIFLNYYYFHYWITPGELFIRSGIISKNQRNIPLRRIQNIEITQNFLQRILGIAVVKAETAGGSETEGHLEFVSTKDAEKIRDVIKSYQNQSEPIDEAEVIVEGFPSQPKEKEIEKTGIIFSLSIKELVVYGLMRFRPMALFFGLISFQYINMIPGLNETLFSDFDIQSIFTLGTTKLIIILLVTVLTSLIIDMLLTINQYFGFTLSREGDKLMTDQGLLGKKKGTIPLKKVQFISIFTNTFARLFSLSGLKVQTAGLGVRKGLPEVAIPLANDTKVIDLGSKIHRFTYPFELSPISNKYIRRRMIKLFIFMIPLALITFFTYTEALYAFGIYPLFLIPIYIKWRNYGYQIQNKHIIIKKGLFFHETTVVPIEKIQTIIFHSGFFQRQLGLASLNIDTAGTPVFDDASIVDIDFDHALALQREILDKYHEQVNN
jgi:putative membrane protein